MKTKPRAITKNKKTAMQKTIKVNVNIIQKKILAEFMMQHPAFARNSMSGGKAEATKLWVELGAKLNAEGPPFKGPKMWRKVYTDQKHNVKKKITLKETAGKEIQRKKIYLTRAEQQIIEAAGLDTTDLESLPPLSKRPRQYFVPENRIIDENRTSYQIDPQVESDEYDYDDDEEIDYAPESSETTPINEVASNSSSVNEQNMLNSLNTMIHTFGENQNVLNDRLDKLITKYEGSVQMREEQHSTIMAAKRLELEIKTIELEILKTRSMANVLNMT